ncbi:MAG TPA: hypothetical protein VD866_10945 [Urbifossiella sp.]|nr:hypothetical protein [Urbifossiella sp.]
MKLLATVVAVAVTAAPAAAQAGKVAGELAELLVRGEARAGAKAAAVGGDVLRAFRAKAVVKAVATEEQLLARLRAAVPLADDAALTSFKALPPAEKAVVADFVEAQARVVRAHPEGARTAAWLTPEGIAQTRVHGPWVADIGRQLSGPEAAAALARSGLSESAASRLFRAAVRKTGAGLDVFWRNVVVPHWGKLLAAGGLAYILTHPDEFVDAAGDLVEGATQRLATFGVRLADKLPGEIGESVRGVVWAEARDRPVGTVVAGVAGVAGVLLLLRKFVRWYAAAWRGGPALPSGFPPGFPPGFPMTRPR